MSASVSPIAAHSASSLASACRSSRLTTRNRRTASAYERWPLRPRPLPTLMAGSCKLRSTVSASMRRMRCCLSNFSTVACAQPCALAGVGAMIPQIEKPRRRHVTVGELQHLRIVPPQLMMDAVAQPNAFLRQFLGKARPRPQLDQPRVGNMQAAEQAPIGAHAIPHHVGVPTSSFAPATLNRSRKRSSCFGLIACTTKPRSIKVSTTGPCGTSIPTATVFAVSGTSTAASRTRSARPAPPCGNSRSPTMRPCASTRHA